ncbi:prion-like-(Q/N-rich) domain-bearing protein 25 isoform X2 [Pomacea canaliculata]|uniref:prion-like-(Q/N-rich) domain-bearing protein 25 isoform X2 n=1 Tax=Pomacea canaliculata TaxID=400727 RepID=UPI000D736212|nr:prion-like-(Q/N-rich) domain-bearing protein 25 isoform X2 [Pomacea canaliculata]
MQAILLVTVFSCLTVAANAADVKFGAACPSGDTCTDANTECSGTPPKCVCSSGFTAVSGVCTANGALGTACLSGSTCTGDTLVCDSSVCKKKVGQTCTATADCVAHSTCSTNKCACDSNYNAGLTGMCAQGSAPGTEVGAGATCNATCTGANFECVASKCTCKAGFTLSGNSCNGVTS